MNYRGKKAALYTLGCKLNYAETAAMATMLQEVGFTRVGFQEKADLYVINTCSVTNQGDKSSRNIIRRAIKRNPAAMVVAVGCTAQLKPAEIASIPGVDLVLGTQERFSLLQWIGNLEKKSIPEIHCTPLKDIKQYTPACSWSGRTRSFLKVQDGCDYFCSFCTIPYARGRSRNQSIAETVTEVQKTLARGFKEIVLTGVNIGDFGKSTGETFYDLLCALENVKGLERLRIGSVEPNLLEDRIIDRVACSTVLMPHFHLPLQSGSDPILALMKRRYSTALFASRVKKIRKQIPEAFIGVDVIAGTNGETRERFQESFNFIENLDISQLHAFPYSERSGTQALKIPGKVPMEERKQRTKEYINLSEKKLRAFYTRNLETEHSVLFEGRSHSNQMAGFTDNYIRVETPYDPARINQTVRVRLVSINKKGHVTIAFRD
jgi:threonylcarbamoyladenosine tRNA methylthiotransferase MtaB